ncbi:MAG: DNA repair protein RecN, partial [Actinomycetota bacterium]|nr:DNA repair protein RecN [Actinomycetota bacterium]
MLTELVVEGLGVIDRAEVHFEPGSSALTGETGAGKTLLVAALGLLVGARADRSLVRAGADAARIEGRFTVPQTHPAADFLRAHGALDDAAEDEASPDVEIVMSRTIPADGPAGKAGKARVNGRLVTTAILAGAGRTLVEIAGQHEHQRLGRPSQQRALLDAFAGPGVEALAARVSDAARSLVEARRKAEELAATERERSRELDVLRYEIAEIDAAGLVEGEVAELEALAARLEHAEDLARTTQSALGSLSGEGGVSEAITTTARSLAAQADKDPSLGELSTRLEAAGYELADIADELARRETEPDPAALDATRDRLGLLARLRRKYGDEETDVLAYRDRAGRRAAEIEGAGTELARLQEEVQAFAAEAEALAAELSVARRAAAPEMEKAVESLLADLAMAGAQLKVVIEPRSIYDGGAETVSFLVSANPGEKPAPIAKIASGGELSRIALALHLVALTSTIPTTVFDEVDAGIGGGAARAVGSALAQLAARGVQALVVTHLPQVAAFADHHYRVLKREEAGRVVAEVQPVEGAERVEELSRMLAGLPGSERAREHAQELLELASDTVR